MKTKIIALVAVVMLLGVCQVRADLVFDSGYYTHVNIVPESVLDKTFISSGQILPGEEWYNVFIYNDDTVVDMLGGYVAEMGSYDASTVNVTAGHVSRLDAWEFSTANVSGGEVWMLWAWDSGTVYFSDAAIGYNLGSCQSGTLNMSGGTTEYIGAIDSGTVNLYGGLVTGSLCVGDSATGNIFGYDLVKTNSGGTYGYGQVYGFWFDDSPFSIDLNGSETYSHINLFAVIDIEIEIRPETLNLASKGKWVNCYIWLPDEYDVADIDPNSIIFEDEIQAESFRVDEEQQVATARFNRSEVQNILEPGEVELTVSGELTDRTRFEGNDIIRVIDKGDKK